MISWCAIRLGILIPKLYMHFLVASTELHLYRARRDAPPHEIGAELRKGDRVVAKIEPIHTQGLSPAQVKGFLKQVLLAFSVQAGEELGKFEVQQERSPGVCPIRGCSLREGTCVEFPINS
jgi:hypothetical protein